MSSANVVLKVGSPGSIRVPCGLSGPTHDPDTLGHTHLDSWRHGFLCSISLPELDRAGWLQAVPGVISLNCCF